MPADCDVLSAAEKGLSQHEHDRLTSEISSLATDRNEHTLLPFLAPQTNAAGLLHATDGNSRMLRCLACTAPACQFMRPAVVPSIQSLLEVSGLHYLPDDTHRSYAASENGLVH